MKLISEYEEYKYAMRGRVTDAAKFLDQVVPGWFNLVDLQALHMNDCTQCVLGQVFGHKMENKLRSILGEDTPEWCSFRRGFDRGYDYLEKMGLNQVQTRNAFGYDVFLKCMWAEEIAERCAIETLAASAGPSCKLVDGQVVCD